MRRLWLLVPIAFACLAFCGDSAYSQKKKDKSDPSSAMHAAEEFLTPSPRPKKAPLPPSRIPLEFVADERVAFVGNGTGERMNLYGNFETALHQAFPAKKLVVRNFCRPADEVALRQRAGDYTKLDDPLHAFNPDTFICFFGYNESFAGPEGVAKFKADYLRFFDEFTAKYPRDDEKSPPRFVLISPIAFEETADSFAPDAAKINANLKLYATAVGEVAKERGLAFVDLYERTNAIFNKEAGKQFTLNGTAVTEAGDREVANILYAGLIGTVPNLGGAEFEKIRAAVNDKSWVNLQDYRMLNGWYVYGQRRTFDHETFPREYVKIRNMAAARDRFVWSLAAGKPLGDKPDDANTGELIVPPTRFGQEIGRTQEKELFYLGPEELIKSCKIPDDFAIKVFADEKEFPEIAKPCQLAFDGKGRLWLSTMPSYPQWRPGDPAPADKLVILEDTDNDGKADKRTVFYDKLHCPTGFEFYNGGVIVVSQPRLLFLKDTNGDDKADHVEEILDGIATEDTHHTMGAFEWSHGGYLKMLEGVSMSTAVETPWGPFRNHGSSGCYTLDPRTMSLSHYVTPGYGNPWCYVFNEWGQGIVGDGTGASQHWDVLLSGFEYSGKPSISPTIPSDGMRPVIGSEFLRTRQFPDEMQKQFIFACCINMNGLTRFDFKDDGSGYFGSRHKGADGKPFDLLASTHKHFRPVDPQIGPDGALWFGDWANAMIGHMQSSQRDPSRDHSLGRVYRLYYTKKPLLKPVLQDGKSVVELLEQLKEYENRTRYRARRELWARPVDEVRPAVGKWVAGLKNDDPDYDRLLCEAMWVLQGHRIVETALLEKILALPSADARAAAVKVAVDERSHFPATLDVLLKYATDESPRVRIEALRGLSFFRTPAATDAVIAAAKMPLDKWLRHEVVCALGATESAWTGRYVAKTIGQEPEVAAIMKAIIKDSKTIGAALPYMETLLGSKDAAQEERNKAMSALASMRGNPDKGKSVIKALTCLACHKIGDDGQAYGPALDKVGTRWNKMKIIESIIDPNAELHKDFITTQIEDKNGKTYVGLVIEDKGPNVVLFDSKTQKPITIPRDNIDVRNTLKQSSMPEGLAATMAPNEFLDVIEYLYSLK